MSEAQEEYDNDPELQALLSRAAASGTVRRDRRNGDFRGRGKIQELRGEN